MRAGGSGYRIAVLVSGLLHGGLLVLLISGWHPEFKPRQLPPTTYIEAALLQVEAPPSPPQAAAKPRAAPQPPRTDPAEARRREQAAQVKAAAEQAAREKTAADQAAREQAARKSAAEKAVREKAAAEKIAKQKAVNEKAAKEKAAREKAAREKAAAEKSARDKAAREKAAAEKAAAEQAAREKAAAEQAARAAAQGQQMVATYESYIRDRISSNWNRPPSARRDMEVQLRIRLVPTGQVMGVSVVRSSGDAAFDQSAVNAVEQAGRFERLQELARKDPLLFERTFRTLTLTFRAEDLRL